ncbi:MAG: hypothetical protein JHD16_03295 [Solirubrobacteraceae bacterium]|nr:hypothetical protein [Solirubrobacteraceae bacterium]
MRLVTLGVAAVATLSLGACGVAEPEEPAAVKPVELEVSPAKFSKTAQLTGDDVTLSMNVKNVGTNPASEVIVQLIGNTETTLANPADEGRLRTDPDDLPDAVTRAAWFVDDAPDRTPISSSNLYPTGGVLKPGESREVKWRMNASRAGSHELEYRVFVGLTDNAAKATRGTGLTGTVSATIANK